MTPEDEQIALLMQAMLETQLLGEAHLGLYYGEELIGPGYTIKLGAEATNWGGEVTLRSYRLQFPHWARQLKNAQWQVRLSSMDGIVISVRDVRPFGPRYPDIYVSFTNPLELKKLHE